MRDRDGTHYAVFRSVTHGRHWLRLCAGIQYSGLLFAKILKEAKRLAAAGNLGGKLRQCDV